MQAEEPTSPIAISLSNQSFCVDDFKSRMAMKIVKYGEPHNSFINKDRATLTNSHVSKGAEYAPNVKVMT